MVLNSDEAVKAFARGGNVTIGGSISAAAGPIGTGGQVAASMVNPAPIFSYSRSTGECLFRNSIGVKFLRGWDDCAFPCGVKAML